MPASITDQLRKGAAAFSTTLASQKAQGAASMSLSDATGVPTDTAVDFTVGRVDSSGNRTPSQKAVYTGTLSGTTVSNLTLIEGTDQLHAAGTPVEITFTAATHNDMVDALLSVMDQDATLKAGAVDVAAVLASSVVTNAKILDGTIDLSAKSAPWDGWVPGSGTWTYASASTFTVPAADAAAMAVGTKIKLTQTSAKYFYVTGISGTTITVTGGSDYTVANAAITSPYFSNVSTPKDFPTFFNYTPTLVNWTIGTGGAAATTAKFSMHGKQVFMAFTSVLGTSGQSVGNNPTISLPVTSITYPTTWAIPTPLALDHNGSARNGWLSWVSTTTAGFRQWDTNNDNGSITSTSPWTWDAGDLVSGTLTYEAA